MHGTTQPKLPVNMSDTRTRSTEQRAADPRHSLARLHRMMVLTLSEVQGERFAAAEAMHRFWQSTGIHPTEIRLSRRPAQTKREVELREAHVRRAYERLRRDQEHARSIQELEDRHRNDQARSESTIHRLEEWLNQSS